MSIDHQLQTTEELQELFDRRTRILQDLKIVDELISTKLGELLGQSVALPSMAARGSGTQRRGRVTPQKQKALPAAPTKSKPKPKPKQKGPGRGRPAQQGGTTAVLIDLLKSSPRKEFTVAAIASQTKRSAPSVRATLVRLVNQSRLHRVRPGVYRWDAPKS